jgi:hypothetical protein
MDNKVSRSCSSLDETTLNNELDGGTASVGVAVRPYRCRAGTSYCTSPTMMQPSIDMVSVQRMTKRHGICRVKPMILIMTVPSPFAIYRLTAARPPGSREVNKAWNVIAASAYVLYSFNPSTVPMVPGTPGTSSCSPPHRRPPARYPGSTGSCVRCRSPHCRGDPRSRIGERFRRG